MMNIQSLVRNTSPVLLSLGKNKHKAQSHATLAWLTAALIAFVSLTTSASAQEESASAHARSIKIDSSVVTEHETKILGKRVKYSATTGTQPVWNSKDEAVATLFYTYYQRTDVKENTERPLIISFNGGPGSASVWMHVAYTGPRILNIDDEGYPVQPYGVQTNPYSILDVADIVFVNPVNTGYSRVLPKADGSMPSQDEQQKMFFGVNADISYLADWVNTFVTRNNRWRSPKYLIGESYGTTRVSGLALELQNRQWMYLNGVVLVSPTDIGIERNGPVKAANRLPYFAAAAWYHNKLEPALQNKDLTELLPEVEDFTINTLIPALAKGGFIGETEKRDVLTQMARYSGLSEASIAQNNLDVSTAFFWKDLLRDEGKTLGRLDSRYLGIDAKQSGDRPDYWAELTSWLHSFTPAINYYLREELNYKTDIKYNMFGNVHPWDRSNNQSGENLRLAMAQNPYLNVMIQAGYYDGATNYFDAKYTMWQLDQSGNLKDRLSFKGYRSGHMMYLRRDDLKQSNQDLREFIKMSTPGKGIPAEYKR
ncbi:Carboxypeptidase C (Cathepsin A) [Alteromonas macleodii]|nr:Carboxypeptidase C (cathepsin A) [Alteromonas macleodii]CAI3961996.1 Carboxypeptidase C (cathepsin A) [Alteromonas macleodii]CAI3962389.1 Carboxypeptidase C (cathepsin A) [Alteromonas macleodii]CAI3962396.1 Carboxypeptidase C (cathepsin A) [Alteromonas macleodii]VTO40119.1 Carboxypeptidase C (cathepsin A) [Alteromonas macleodii]|tara:strand:- start:176 stop:1795 length:1620 start_codon:yes stop_codon:yes gene_type:complete